MVVSRRTRLVAVGLLAVVAVVLVALVLGRGSAQDAPGAGDEGPTDTVPSVEPEVRELPDEVAQEAPELDESQAAAAGEAEDQLRAFLADITTFDGATVTDAVRRTAAGPALSELEALAQQYANEGISVSGSPQVVATRIVSADGDDVLLAACLDSSEVTVRDEAGNDLTADRSESERVVLNLYQLQRIDGRWIVVNHSIPADSACSGDDDA